ncbi:hypothetical protein XENTR_v10019371 [Xenopus tropicalis]|nr:hypothetical protein XENTR_v10019371 [Xenopus tropicalis]
MRLLTINAQPNAAPCKPPSLHVTKGNERNKGRQLEEKFRESCDQSRKISLYCMLERLMDRLCRDALERSNIQVIQ